MGIGSVEALIEARAARQRFFPADLFADPTWDILLDLHLAEYWGKKISVSSACIAANVPTTTALRYIQILKDRGFIERRPTLDDKRKVYLSLTPRTRVAMEKWMRAARIATMG